MPLDQVIVRRSDGALEIATPRASWPAVGGWAGFLVVGVALLATGDGVFMVMGGVVALVAGVGLRELRRAGVRLTATSIVERGDLRPRRWATGSVRRFTVDKTPHIVPWQSLWIELDGAERRPLEQVRVFGRGSSGRDRLERAAEDANEWLRGLREGGSASFS